MVGGRVSQNPLGDPVVNLHGISELLPICFESDIKRRPTCGKFHFPHQLPVPLRNFRVAFEPASLHELLPQLCPLTLVVHRILARAKGKGLGDVDALAVLAHGGIREQCLVLRLAHQLVDFLAYGSRMRDYGPDLVIQLTGGVRLGPALKGVLDAELVERIPEQGPHMFGVGGMAVEGVGDP